MISVRPVQLDEWAELKKLRLEALQNEPTAYGDTFEAASNYLEEHWQAMARERNYFVAVAEDGTFVGMLAGDRHFERAGHWMFGFYVTPAFRGQGVADELVAAVTKWATDTQGVSLNLYVTQTVERANGFYRRLGFQKTGDTVTMDRDPRIVLDHLRKVLGEFTIIPVDPEQLHDLRRRVLRSGIENAVVADTRDHDSDALHYAGLINDQVVVSASFYPSPAPVNESLMSYQLRYMAVDFDVQGMGFGKEVLDYAEAELRRRGARQMWANGRDTALGFYQATGWQFVPGSEHLSKETGLPHTVIYKVL